MIVRRARAARDSIEPTASPRAVGRVLTTEQARAAGDSVILGAPGESHGTLIHEPDLSHNLRNPKAHNFYRRRIPTHIVRIPWCL